MSERIPCPVCGSESGPEAAACGVCGYRLDVETHSSGKCARCGSSLGAGFEFCQICGLRVQSRRIRPVTQSLRVLQPRRGDTGPQTPVGASEAAAIGRAVTGESPLPEGPAPSFTAVGAERRSPVTATGQAAGGGAAMPVRSAAGEGAQGPAWPLFAAPVPARTGTTASDATQEPRATFEPAPARKPDPTSAEETEHKPGNNPAPRSGEIAVGPPAWSPPSAPRISQASDAGPAQTTRRVPGASRLRLVLVQRDGSEGEVVPLGDAPLTIGRSQGDLRFPADEFLGAIHARVEPLPTGVRIADLETRNGIFVRISRPEAVVPGDLFLIGHHLLRLENIPAAGREQDAGPDGVRGFGTPLQPAWGRLVLLGPGGVEAETHYLRHPQVVFGRELGDVVFPADPFVSWQHAQLSVEVVAEAMRVTLTDLRSANGTYLRARGDVILDPGDMFRVGDQIFRVRMH